MVESEQSSSQGANSPTAKPTGTVDDMNGTTTDVTASEHGRIGDANNSYSDDAMSKNNDVDDPVESNIAVVTDVKWHVTELLLLTHVVDGRVMEAPVNANPVVSETTSKLQNTLAGNPIEAKLTEGDVISSSIVSVLIMNKPKADKLCDKADNVSYPKSVCIPMIDLKMLMCALKMSSSDGGV